MSWDRFDIVEAWFVWLCSHHDGKGYERSHPKYWSSYGRLSTMEHRLHYRPAPNTSLETLSENGKEIHDNLCRRAGWCDCLTTAAHPGSTQGPGEEALSS